MSTREQQMRKVLTNSLCCRESTHHHEGVGKCKRSEEAWQSPNLLADEGFSRRRLLETHITVLQRRTSTGFQPRENDALLLHNASVPVHVRVLYDSSHSQQSLPCHTARLSYRILFPPLLPLLPPSPAPLPENCFNTNMLYLVCAFVTMPRLRPRLRLRLKLRLRPSAVQRRAFKQHCAHPHYRCCSQHASER